MGLIRLNRRMIGNQASRRKGKSTIKFKSNSVAGYVPLLKLFEGIVGSNDYFRADVDISVMSTVLYKIDMGAIWTRFSFRKNMRSYMNYDNPQSTIVMSMLSILGIQGKRIEYVSRGRMNNRGISFAPIPQSILVANPVDVFVLAMVKISDIHKIVHNTEDGFMELDSSLITFFVSEEKFHKKEFLEENYNKTVAKHLRNELESYAEQMKINIEIVPDSTLKQYYTNPYSIESNSISEIMEIDKQVKEKVLSHVSDKLMFVE